MIDERDIILDVAAFGCKVAVPAVPVMGVVDGLSGLSTGRSGTMSSEDDSSGRGAKGRGMVPLTLCCVMISWEDNLRIEGLDDARAGRDGVFGGIAACHFGLVVVVVVGRELTWSGSLGWWSCRLSVAGSVIAVTACHFSCTTAPFETLLRIRNYICETQRKLTVSASSRYYL